MKKFHVSDLYSFCTDPDPAYQWKTDQGCFLALPTINKKIKNFNSNSHKNYGFERKALYYYLISNGAN